jgi:hypothetical protein
MVRILVLLVQREQTLFVFTKKFLLWNWAAALLSKIGFTSDNL